MIGLVGGFFLAALAFYLVISRFDSRLWVAGVCSLIVWGLCALTGIFGVIAGAIIVGGMFKIDT